MSNPGRPPPLHGVRVLERTTSVAGQSAGMLFADLGADVVRLVDADTIDDVEHTGLAGWLCWNRGKRLVGHPVEATRLDRLLERADVLLVDAGPVELAASGLDAESLRMRAPGLVNVWMPPIAARGRWSELPHDHLLLDAIGGFAAHHPALEERPVASVVPTRHLVQGALAAVAAMSGLIARCRDGWGRSATVTGLHAEAATLNTLVARSIDGPPMVSPGKFLPGSPNFRLYQGSDGRWLFLAALSPELFIRALEVLDRLDLLAHPDIAGDFLNILRPEIGAVAGAELDAAFASSSAEEWVVRFAAADVPAALVGDPDTWLSSDVIAHACPPVVRKQRDVGDVLMPGPAVTLSVDAPLVGDLPHPGGVGDAAEVWIDVTATPAPAAEAPGPDDHPLDGLKVIDLATYLAAPFVSTLLACHGADVVKAEAPAGDPYSVFNAPYAIVNEHKPRLSVDLDDPEARAGLLDMIGHADVVVDNLVASSLARRGMTPDVFESANPDLVRCSVTAYGAEGPHAELPGFDPIMQTLSGLVSVQGGAGRPVATAAPVHDIATGCLGALGTLAALWVRRHRGHGQRVFGSLAATSTYLQSGELTTYAGRPDRPIGGVDFPGPSSWQRFYRAADRWIAVSAATVEHRTAFLGVLERFDLSDASDAERAAEIAAIVGAHPCEEWLVRMERAGVPVCSAIGRVELDDPFLVENDYSHVVDTPHVGRLEIVSGYTDWHHTDRRPPLPVDRLVADSDVVLSSWSSWGTGGTHVQ